LKQKRLKANREKMKSFLKNKLRLLKPYEDFPPVLHITASKRNLGFAFFMKDFSMFENAFSGGTFR
jgi:hypothetical protein